MEIILKFPKDFACDLQTLENNTVVFYQIFEFYHPECVQGVRWDDPAFGVEWPLRQLVISAKGQNYAFLQLSEGGKETS